jgi:hypothetical protein
VVIDHLSRRSLAVTVGGQKKNSNLRFHKFE